jgi:hypothetical protein
LGMFPPFGPFWRNFPTRCLRETPFKRVSGGNSSKWTKWIKHSPIENSCGIFSPYAKNNPVADMIFLHDDLYNLTLDSTGIGHHIIVTYFL